MPDWVINLFIAMGENIRTRKRELSPAVRDILGKPARTTEAFIREHLKWFK